MTMKDIESTPSRRRLLHYREDTVMFVRAILAPAFLLIPAVFGMPDGWLGLAAGLSLWFVLNDMNFLLHQHVHRPWTTSKVINRWIDLTLSMVTGMSSSNWRLTHILRHHKGDDSWGRGFHWEMSRRSIVGAISYSVRGIPIVLFYPIGESFVRAFVRKPSDSLNYPLALLEQLAVVGIGATLISLEPWFYGPYYFSVLFFSRLTDYQNHVGCDEKSQYGFSNNVLQDSYNWVRYNFGYHTAHHYFPTAHWTELPALHAKISGKIPEERMTATSWTGFYTPPLIGYWGHLMFRNLWRDSRVSEKYESAEFEDLMNTIEIGDENPAMSSEVTTC